MSEVEQLDLIPEKPFEKHSCAISLDRLPAEFIGPSPEADLIESIRRDGLLEPVHLAVQASGQLDVLTGRRRVAAFRKLLEETGDEQYRHIPAILISGASREQQAVVAIKLHSLRRENIAAELDSMEELTERGASMAEICASTGLPPNVAKARLRLVRAIIPSLRVLLRNGEVSESVVMHAARLSSDLQREARKIFDKSGKLSAVDIRQLRRAVKADAMQAMPDAIFNVSVSEKRQPHVPPAVAEIVALIDQHFSSNNQESATSLDAVRSLVIAPEIQQWLRSVREGWCGTSNP